MTAITSKPPDGDKKKEKEKKEKNVAPTKVVVRRLPPSMTEEEFLDQVSPIPDHDYFRFVRADYSLGQDAFCRAYLNFLQHDDIFLFQEKFDGYVFVDAKGNEYVAIVEFAPYQKITIQKDNKRKDPKINSIEQDPEYLKFLEGLEKGPEGTGHTVESTLEAIEQREREVKAGRGPENQMTPLLLYLKEKKDEKIKKREEMKDMRKKKEEERKKAREEERQKKREMKEKEAREKDKREKEKLEKRNEKIEEDIKNRQLDKKKEKKEKESEKNLITEGGKEHEGKDSESDKKDLDKKESDKKEKKEIEREKRLAREEKEKERFRKREEEKIKQRERKKELLEKKKEKERKDPDKEENKHDEAIGESKKNERREKDEKKKYKEDKDEKRRQFREERKDLKEDPKDQAQEVKEEGKTKKYSDRRKEERLKREREKAEKKRKEDGIITIIDVEDESSRDDVTDPTPESSALSENKISITHENSEGVGAQPEKEKRGKKSYRERREERDRRNEKKDMPEEDKKKNSSEDKEAEKEKKDRKFKKPDMQIYRPGMGKFSSKSIKKDDDGKSPKSSPDESRESSPSKKVSRSERSSRNQSPEEKKGKNRKKHHEDYYYDDEKSYSTKEYYSKKKGSGSDEYFFEDNRGYKSGKGISGKGYRANRESKYERKKKDVENDDKSCTENQNVNLSDSKTEIDTSIDSDHLKRNEKVVEKAEQECMEKPVSVRSESEEKAKCKEPSKQFESDCKEHLASSIKKDFNLSEGIGGNENDARDCKTKPDEIEIPPLTSAPTVITIDNDQ